MEWVEGGVEGGRKPCLSIFNFGGVNIHIRVLSLAEQCLDMFLPDSVLRTPQRAEYLRRRRESQKHSVS